MFDIISGIAIGLVFGVVLGIGAGLYWIGKNVRLWR